jgi:Protein of unknown function (DUF3562)
MRPGRVGWQGASMLLDHQIERERASQVKSVRKFARDRKVPEDFAVAVYEREWRQLHDAARVHRFVGVLAEKHAKEAVRNR